MKYLWRYFRTAKELFIHLKEIEYKKVGDDVDYKIEVNHEDERVYLFFQCSASERDWKNNLNFPAKLYKHQKNKVFVHRGFGEAWKSANDKIMSEFILECNEHILYTPTIVGWSYGGAMSQLACEDFHFRTFRRAEVVTFGSPKILYGLQTRNYFKDCCRKVFQYAQPNDFVTWCIPIPFVHHIKKVKCGDKFSFFKIFKTDYYHCNYDVVLE